MNAEDALAYLQSFTWSRSRLGLERERRLLAFLGDPQKKLRFVHVAGTNGKGSTCSMLASVLQSAGYKTGLFTSPHIDRYNERIKINGADISDERLTALVEKIQPFADGMDEHPSFLSFRPRSLSRTFPKKTVMLLFWKSAWAANMTVPM